jgi:transaldolase
MNPLHALAEHGQSVWLDFIRRDLLDSGALARMIAADDLRGLTSNPAIFEKAIAGTTLYDAALRELVQAGERDPERLAERLAIQDIQAAADVFRPVFERTHGADGWVSLEVSPQLAHDSAGTLAEARRLHAAVARPNLMIKVPGTPAGVPAIRTLIAEGICVNVTLLFSRSAYHLVAEAYLQGLEQRAAAGLPLDTLASVASFFVSRIDSAVDPRLPPELQGKVAIANARLAYQDDLNRRYGERWQRLAAQGARAQRLLWASTGTKDPKASDILYIKSLASPFTVNTMPEGTLKAFADHGEVAGEMASDGGDCEAVLASFGKAGIDIDALAQRLQDEGAASFVKSWNDLMGAIESKSTAMRKAS